MSRIPLDQIELITSVDLNYRQGNSGKPVYHSVYGSSVYDSLFGIFAKFDGAQAGNAFEVTKIHFKIVNYSGNFTIGFHSAPEINDDNSVVTLNIRGMSVDDEEELSPKNKLTIQKGVPYRIVFERLLHPLLPSKFPTRKPGEDISQRIQGEVPHEPVFDSEFYHRNGVDYYHRELRPGHVGHKETGTGNNKSTSGILWPSPRCTQSDVNLIF